jgi:hypothetical protein
VEWQESLYTSDDYLALLAKHNITVSMSRTGDRCVARNLEPVLA